MPRKGKEKNSKASTDDKVQTEALNSNPEYGSMGMPGSKENASDTSFSVEKAHTHDTSLQSIQGPSSTTITEQSSIGEDKEFCSTETSNKYKHTEKALGKPKEKLTKVEGAVMSDGSEDTKKLLAETDICKESVDKQVEATSNQFSPHLLKWSNIPIKHAKGKKKKIKKKEEKPSRQTEVLEYFAVRRSDRKSKSVIQSEKQNALEQALLSGKEQDLEVQEVEGKGRGVFAKRDFTRGQFVCEYSGELINYETAKEREKFYEGKTEFGCYMYYFTFKNEKLCVDATKESDKLGRLLNHSRTGANCATRQVSVKDKPYLILETVRDVKAGEELLYDYGERSKDILQFHQWLKS